MNENINYYKLGKRYARRPFEDPLYESLPTMDFEQMAAFNKGYEDGEKRPSIGAAFFVLFLATVVVCGIVVFIK